MDLLEKIVEITANSVTPEEFKETWGYTLDEHVENMMDRVHELEATEAPASIEKEVAEEKREFLMDTDSERATMEEVAATIKELAMKLAKLDAITLNGKEEKGKAKGRRLVAKKEDANQWALKLVALKTGSGKTIPTGAPVVITTRTTPVENGKMVARLYSSKEKDQSSLHEINFEGGLLKILDHHGGVREMKLVDGVKGLMVDVGDLKVGDLVETTPKVPEIPKRKGPKI